MDRIAETITVSCLCVAVVLQAGCGGQRAAQRPAPPATGSKVEQQAETNSGGKSDTSRILLSGCEPPGAQIKVDGAGRGTVAEVNRRGGLSVTPGVHRLELTHPGYRSYRIELRVGKGRSERLNIQLQRNAR